MNEKILDLLKQYLEMTKIMCSAVESRQMPIFEEQLQTRKAVLVEIEANYKDITDKSDFTEIILQIKKIESKIEIEIELMKEEVLRKQAENKLKMNSLKKSNLITNKYKYGNIDNYQSTYIDNKK